MRCGYTLLGRNGVWCPIQCHLSHNWDHCWFVYECALGIPFWEETKRALELLRGVFVAMMVVERGLLLKIPLQIDFDHCGTVSFGANRLSTRGKTERSVEFLEGEVHCYKYLYRQTLITVGLFMSALIFYPLGKKRSGLLSY